MELVRILSQNHFFLFPVYIFLTYFSLLSPFLSIQTLTADSAVRNYAPENYQVVQEIYAKERKREDKRSPPHWSSYFF